MSVRSPDTTPSNQDDPPALRRHALNTRRRCRRAHTAHNHHIKSSPDGYPTDPTAVTMTNNTQEGVPMATMAGS